MTNVTLGIEEFIASPPPRIRGKRLGLLCNQGSTDRSYRHSRDLLLAAFPGQLTCLFTPQHGFFAEKQDNMVESDHGIDPASGLPVFSLYSRQRRPSPAMFDHIDLLLIDLPDVGTRVYTFMSTLIYCLEMAAVCGKGVIVLDRPNPVGGKTVEGNIIRDDCFSFVGLYPMPMRHGMTFGELALMFNTDLGINAELEIVPIKGWQRSMSFMETGLPWVFPSPNMPTPDTALVYPGQVIWEGTNVSEGRGTTMPFLLCGAPYWNHAEIRADLTSIPLPGCHLRPVVFEPVAHKWNGCQCNGFQIHVTDFKTFLPYRTSLALLCSVMHLYPDQFQYKSPPYEYEYERLPLDLILGDVSLRQALESRADLLDLERGWQADLDRYDLRRQRYFLYDQP